MQFYRRLTAIKAISFDLDDTLYNNRPIMQAIEDKMVVYFTEKFASLFSGLSPETEVGRTHEPHQIYNRHFWAPYREQAISANHELTHDVVILRFESYRLGLIAHNIEAADAVLQAQAAVDYFISLRSDFIVPKVSHELLASLSKKFPLVAISNGNVNTKLLSNAN